MRSRKGSRGERISLSWKSLPVSAGQKAGGIVPLGLNMMMSRWRGRAGAARPRLGRPTMNGSVAVWLPRAVARLAAVQTVSSGRVKWESLLADLSRVLPSQVYLQSLNMTSPTPAGSGALPAAGATAASGFTAAGAASSHVRVALVLDRLALLPWLSDVTLGSSTGGSSGPGLSAGDAFSVTAGFGPSGGAR